LKVEGSKLARFPRLVPVQSAELLKAVYEAAAGDGHGVMFPSHAVVKGGEVVGAFSVGNCPLVTMWLGPKVGARESFGLMNSVECLVSGRGSDRGAVLVSKSSPFYRFMSDLGFEEQGEMAVFTKKGLLCV
jgi:hypothetical protein